MSSYMKGIDVSEHNGVIDWEKVKKSGIQFAMIRGGFGLTLDNQFIRNATECTRVGVPFGIYWFSYAMNPERAAQEAEFCLAAVKSSRVDLPVAYDYEYDSVNYAAKKGLTVTKALVSKMAKAFLDAVRKSGRQAVNYTNADFLNRYFDASVNYPLWLAQWPSGVPALDKPPRDCLIWQYSANGTVPGINGDVDLDVYYGNLEKTQPLTDRQKVQQVAELADSTMDFLECYKYGPDLLRKLAAAMKA